MGEGGERTTALPNQSMYKTKVLSLCERRTRREELRKNRRGSKGFGKEGRDINMNGRGAVSLDRMVVEF